MNKSMNMKNTSHITGSFKLMAQVNSRLVLDAVRRAGETSRAELARETHLQPATIGNIASSLIDQGLLVDTDIDKNASSSVGRPARMLKLNEKARLSLAIDLEPDRLRIALLNLALEVLAYSEHSLDRFSPSDKILSLIIFKCEDLISANNSWRNKIIGVGISLPGEVDVENGTSRSSTNMPYWKDVNIVEVLKNALHLPVRIGKSFHLAGLSEKWRRPEIRDRKVLCLALRTGVGVALLINGNLYNGASHLDGEIGHTIIDINGKPCECGKRGCLETFISSTAIRERGIKLIKQGEAIELLDAAKGSPETISPEMIYELAQQGNEPCADIVRDVVKYLGLGMANLVQILNPHEVVVCGSIDLVEDIMLEELNRVFDQVLLPQTRLDLKVLVSPYKDRAALFGAGVLVLDELFGLPTLTFPKNHQGNQFVENEVEAMSKAVSV